jgi:hypothetical protein
MTHGVRNRFSMSRIFPSLVLGEQSERIDTLRAGDAIGQTRKDNHFVIAQVW